jgi:hypothetical protein
MLFCAATLDESYLVRHACEVVDKQSKERGEEETDDEQVPYPDTDGEQPRFLDSMALHCTLHGPRRGCE